MKTRNVILNLIVNSKPQKNIRFKNVFDNLKKHRKIYHL